MKKRNILVVALLICILLIPMAGSLAFFTQAETAHNVITTGNVDIELQEFTDEKDKDGNPLPFKDPVGVMPGQEVSKIVQIRNTGSGDAWVRIALLPEFRLDGAHAAEGFEPDMELVIPDINTEDWELGREDGYLYYKHALKPGETTTPALRSVSFSRDMSNGYQESSFILEVQAEAVQVKNNGESALTAAGWPAAPQA